MTRQRWTSVVAAFVLALTAQAQTVVWVGTSGVWSSGGNWSTGVMPPTGSTVSIDVGNAAVTVDVAASIGALTIGSGDSLSIANSRSLRIVKTLAGNGFILNAGILRLTNTSGYNNTDWVIEGGDIALGGGGQVTLSNHGNNRIYGAASTDRLINENNTIAGAGQIGVNTMGIVNRGSIVADQTNALTIDPGDLGLVNAGTLRANGGRLNLFNGTFTNFEGPTRGTIEALGTSIVDLDGVIIVGGNLATGPEALIRNLGTATLNGVTLQSGARFAGQNASSTTVIGTLVNGGTFSLLNTSGYNNTDLVVDGGDVTVSGGEIVLSNHGNNRIRGTAPTYRFILDNGTLSGAGQLGVNSIGFVNRGLIVANQSSALTVDPSAAGFVNRGILRASGGTLSLTNGTYANTEAGAAGRIEAATASVVNLNGASIVGGILASTGSGLLRNVGTATLTDVTLEPGTSFSALNATSTTVAGTIANAGDIALNNSSGYNNTDLIISGTVTLTGAGSITFSNHDNNRMRALSTGDRLVNEANTIAGAGQLGVNTLALTNRGTISGSYSTGLTIDTTGAANYNAGTIRAPTGGLLTLQDTTLVNSADGTAGLIEANNGVVRLAAGSHVSLGNVAVVGAGELQLSASTLSLANLQGSPTGFIRTTSGASVIDRGTLDNPAGGQMVLNNSTSLQFNAGGNYRNSGTLLVNNTSGYNNTDLIFSGGDVVITGTGGILLSNHSNNRVRGAASTDRLVLDGGTIAGSGQLGLNSMGFVNRGTILANQATALTLDPSDAGVVNRGVLRASGGTLNLWNGTFNQVDGAVVGRLEALDASLVDLNGATIVGGTFVTAGTGLVRNVGTATLQDVLLAGATFFATNGSTTTLAGTLQNTGTLSLNNNSGYNNTDLVITGTVTLAGTGAVTLSNHAQNRIYGATGSEHLINDGNLIQGGGQLGVNQTTITNRGTIVANQPAALTIDPGSGGLFNRGSLRADNGVLNLLNGTFTNEVDGVPGMLETVNAGRIDLNAATIVGGTIATAAATQIRNIGTAVLNGVTFAAGTNFFANNGSTTTLVGTIHNHGTMSLNNNSGYNNTDLVISGPVSLLDGGVLALTNHSYNRILGTGTLTNGAGHTVRGSGQFGVNQLTLVNQGTIEANQPTPLTVDLNNAAPLSNQGTLRAVNGGNLVFVDPLTNAGVVAAAASSTLTAQSSFTQTTGMTMMQGGTLWTGSASFQSTGSVAGAGIISGPVTNSGVIAPGAASTGTGLGYGVLTFNHALTLTPTSLLHLELGGTTSFDRIAAQTAVLNGTVVVTFGDNFHLSVLPTDSFTLLSTANAAGLSGGFTSLANGARLFTADGLGSFQVNYLASSFTLSNFQPVPEPSTFVLLAAGATIVLASIRRSRRR